MKVVELSRKLKPHQNLNSNLTPHQMSSKLKAPNLGPGLWRPTLVKASSTFFGSTLHSTASPGDLGDVPSPKASTHPQLDYASFPKAHTFVAFGARTSVRRTTCTAPMKPKQYCQTFAAPNLQFTCQTNLKSKRGGKRQKEMRGRNKPERTRKLKFLHP